MKFNAKMAKDMADCYNEIDNNWDLLIYTLFTYARNGKYVYSTSYEHRCKIIVEHKAILESLGFKVEIDEDMKTAIVSWYGKDEKYEYYNS